MRINRVEHLKGILHSHNTRHWTLSWPKRTALEQFREAVEDENLVESFFDRVVKVLDVDGSKVAMLGYIMTRPIPHCHLAITSSRSGININRGKVKDLKDFWVKLAGNTAKCSAFNLHVWLTYMTGYDNILKSKQRWMEIPISNPKYIEGRRRFLQGTRIKIKK